VDDGDDEKRDHRCADVVDARSATFDRMRRVVARDAARCGEVWVEIRGTTVS
jgi:hypothetical protein|tara:strand:+ start:3918 stop:4073 length:156 start_codon:yes stop_codon:yes gene_type:complete